MFMTVKEIQIVAYIIMHKENPVISPESHGKNCKYVSTFSCCVLSLSLSLSYKPADLISQMDSVKVHLEHTSEKQAGPGNAQGASTQTSTW